MATKTEKCYHVFTDNKDEYPSTLKEANKIYQYFKEAYRCARLYKLVYIDGEMDTEEYIKGFGDYPN